MKTFEIALLQAIASTRAGCLAEEGRTLVCEQCQQNIEALRALDVILNEARIVPEHFGTLNPYGAATIVRKLRAGYTP